jgi:hypothetical protein
MPKKLTKQELLLKIKHSNLIVPPIFLFPESQEYVNQNSYLQFKCEQGHLFNGNVNNTITAKHGCPYCKLYNDRLSKRTPWCEVLEQSNLIHNYKFQYKESSYINYITPITINCPKHGTFQMSPQDHIYNKRGCKLCNCESNNLQRKEDILQRCLTIHNNYYNYDKVVYKNSYTNVVIVCPQHGEFKQTLNTHLRGYGCKLCSFVGVSKKALYWLLYEEKKNNISIQHALNGGEYKIPNTKYYVDGFCKDTNTVYEFHGDVFHGNPLLYQSDERCHPYNKNVTAGELLNKTIKKEQKLKQLGYNVVIIWESDFDKKNIPKNTLFNMNYTR